MDQSLSSDGEDSLLFRWLKRAGVLFSTLIHVVNFVLLLESKWDKLQKGLLLTAILLIWFLTLYLLLWQRTAGKEFGSPHKIPAYPIRTRRAALAGVILIPFLFLAFIYYQSLPSGKVIVVVADIEGPDPQSYRVTEVLLTRLRQVAKPHPEIEIVPLGHSISEYQGSVVAQEEGRQLKASAMIWGWYGKTGEKVLLTSYFEVLTPPLPFFPIDRDVHISPASDLDKFVVQEDLSTKLGYLVLTTVGLIKQEAQDYGASISLLTEALDQKSVAEASKYSAYFYRALAHQHEGHGDLAIADYTASIQAKSDIPESYNNRGNSYFRKSEYDTAITDYDEAIRLKPAYAEAYNNRASARVRKGLVKEGIVDLDKVVELKPDNVEAHLNRGYAYTLLGDHASAISNYEQTIKKAPNDARAYMDRGAAYIQMGNYKASFDDLSRAAELDPNNPLIFNNLGIYYAKQGDMHRAIKEFDKSITLAGKIPLAANYDAPFGNRANAYKNIGRINEALADYEKQITLQPKSASPYHNRGILRRDQGKSSLAINDFSEAIKLDPNYVPAYIGRGHLLIRNGDIDGAIADYVKALNLEPRNTLLYFDLCRARTVKQDFEGALSDCQKAIQFNPNSAQVYDDLGIAKRIKHDFNGAAEAFERATKLNPSDPNPLVNLANTRHDQNRTSEAETLFKQLLLLLDREPKISVSDRIVYLQQYLKFKRDLGDKEEVGAIEKRIRDLSSTVPHS